MKKQLFALVLAGLPLAAVGGFNQAWAAQGQIDSASSTAPVQSTQPSTTLVMRGTIQNYDPSSKVLTLSTANGTMHFTVTSAARIRQGWHRIGASTLEKYSGFHAAVRYSQSGAEKTLESVHVLGKEPK
jgi:phage baseplate assembly protein gpV